MAPNILVGEGERNRGRNKLFQQPPRPVTSCSHELKRHILQLFLPMCHFSLTSAILRSVTSCHHAAIPHWNQRRGHRGCLTPSLASPEWVGVPLLAGTTGTLPLTSPLCVLIARKVSRALDQQEAKTPTQLCFLWEVP